MGVHGHRRTDQVAVPGWAPPAPDPRTRHTASCGCGGGWPCRVHPPGSSAGYFSANGWAFFACAALVAGVFVVLVLAALAVLR